MNLTPRQIFFLQLCRDHVIYVMRRSLWENRHPGIRALESAEMIYAEPTEQGTDIEVQLLGTDIEVQLLTEGKRALTEHERNNGREG